MGGNLTAKAREYTGGKKWKNNFLSLSLREEGRRGEGVVAIGQGGQDGRGERLKGTFKRKIQIRKSFIRRGKIRDTKKEEFNGESSGKRKRN